MDTNEKLKGGVIMDIINAEQARITGATGTVSVIAPERVPINIRTAGGISRMNDPRMIEETMKAVKVPVMAKVRISHFVEAQILESLGIDYIDESEILSPADDKYYINRSKFNIPSVCGVRNLSEALRRIKEGAKMIRTRGEAGTGDVVQAVTHMRQIVGEISLVRSLKEDELYDKAEEMGVCFGLLKHVHENGKLPAFNLSAGGITIPTDAALMRQLGAEGMFVGSGTFKSGNPEKCAKTIVKVVENYDNSDVLLEVSKDLGEVVVGINLDEIKVIMIDR